MKHIWIGLSEHVYYYANQLKFEGNPIIVQRPEQLEGLRGPLIIHFCGDYYERLPYIRKIRDIISRLRATENIEILYHTD
jgi:hypothetical protein